jgi:hypothetical protein
MSLQAMRQDHSQGDGMKVYLDPDVELELTAQVFGQLLVLVWASKYGRSRLPGIDHLTTYLVEGDQIPSEVKKVMHLDNVTTGLSIREMTDYIFAAQSAGFLSRRNPAYIAGTVEISALDAEFLLQDYRDQFPETIQWLEQCLDEAKPEHLVAEY